MSPKDTPKQGRITIRTVAEDAGVSVSAVSKVLRNAYGVSESLREKVQESIDRLGYRPNMAARSMRGSTATIGVLLNDIHNPFLPEIIEGVNAVLEPSHFKAMIGVGKAAVPMEVSLIESMIDYRMDGLLLIAPRLTPEVVADFAAQIPIVMVGYHDPQARLFDTVNTDDELGAEMAIAAFVARGKRRITMVSLSLVNDMRTGVIYQREQGYLRTMAQLGLSDHARIVKAPTTLDPDSQLMTDLLTGPDRPDAIFCWSDLHAIHVLTAVQRRGLRVPEDVAIIGFDNAFVVALPQMDIASMNQTGHLMGQKATQALLERIEGRTTAIHTLVAPELIVRGSLGELPGN